MTERKSRNIKVAMLARVEGEGGLEVRVRNGKVADVKFRAIPPGCFTEFREPDLVKIVWTLEAEPLGPALTRFRHETRVLPTGDDARRKFQSYWRKFSIGIVLIRRLLLPAIRREAERRYRIEGDPEPQAG